MVAMAIFMILSGAMMVGMTNVLRVSEYEGHILDLDNQGYRLMQNLSDQLRSAILPIYLSDSEKQKSGDNIFALLDDPAHGFGGSEGKAWREALKAGVDSLAFVVPVDAQADKDSLDDNNRIEIGQIRPDGTHSLDASFTNSATEFWLRDDKPASSLVDVLPELLADDAKGGLYEVDLLGTGGIMRSSRTADHSSFNVIRYIPKLDSGGNPVVIRESDLGIDLDEDGSLDGEFHIGRMQLVYVGGMQHVQPPRAATDTTSANPPNSLAPVDTIKIDLSGDVVLRNIDGSTPIFKLVRFNPNSIGSDGIVDIDGGEGVMALYIRALLFNPDSFQSMRPRFGASRRSGSSVTGPDTELGFARMFDSVVTLRNMSR